MSTLASRTRPAGALLRRDRDFWSRKLTNTAATVTIWMLTAVAVACLLFILGYVVMRGIPAITPAFFLERPLPYGQEGGGVAPAILGSLEMLLVASVLGVPIGVGSAIYLSEYGTLWFSRSISLLVDLMAGLPSIVVGVFVWAWLVRNVIGQYNGLAGGVALAIIMIPIVTRTVEETLRIVPDTLREASLALGVPRWRTILGVVLPSARAGIITGIVLSVARAGGETAPLLLTALGNQFFSSNLLEPMAALPIQIYNYAVAPYEDWHTKAWGSALVLISVIGVLSLLLRYVVRVGRIRGV